MVKTTKAPKPRLTPEEFVLMSIATLRTESSKGIHTVHSGFNRAYREYFGAGSDPIATTNKMRKDGTIAIFLAKGGVMLYRRSDLKERTLAKHDTEWERRDKERLQKEQDTSLPTEGSSALKKTLKE